MPARIVPLLYFGTAHTALALACLMVRWSPQAIGSACRPSSPFLMRDRRLQAIVFAGWTLAVPALAAGVALESPLWIAAGAWSLLAAVATARSTTCSCCSTWCDRARRAIIRSTTLESSCPRRGLFRGDR